MRRRNLATAAARWAACAALAIVVAPAGAGGEAEPRGEAAAPAAGRTLTRVDHSDLDRMLGTHVRDERVDYVLWRKHDARALDGYLAELGTVDPQALDGRAERLAFYLNLYNAAMVDAVLERLTDGWSPADDDFAVFDEPRVALDGASVSLNRLEHEIIRPRFEEPRIHAALVCAAVSCPPLIARAFRAEDLDATLDDNMRRFIHDDRRNTVRDGRARLSEIFKWYAEDFGDDGPLAYARTYRPELPRGENGWIPYDWRLNAAIPAEGRWVVLEDSGDGLPVGTIAEVLETDGRTLRLALPDGGIVLRSSGARPYDP